MPTQGKIEAVADLKERFETSSAVYAVEYSKITANDMNVLRAQIGDADGHMMIVKNRLVKLAIDGTDAEGLSEQLTGPLAYVFCSGDIVGPAKALATFGDAHPGTIEFRGGFADGVVTDQAEVQKIATLPSKEEIIAGVVGAVASPVTGFVFTLNGLVSDFVYTLQAVADQKSESAA